MLLLNIILMLTKCSNKSIPRSSVIPKAVLFQMLKKKPLRRPLPALVGNNRVYREWGVLVSTIYYYLPELVMAVSAFHFAGNPVFVESGLDSTDSTFLDV